MENITQLLPGLLAVRVPDNASELYIFNDEEPYIFYWIRPETDRLYLPPGFKYTLIGKASEVPEDLAATLVDKITVNLWRNYLINAQYIELLHKSARESLESLLISKGCYSKNPFGNEEPEDVPDLGVVTQSIRLRRKHWKEAQQRVGTWIIIKQHPK